MAFRLAELFVEIGANTGGLNAALAGVHNRLLSMGPIGQKFSASFHGLTNTLMGVGSQLGSAAAGAGLLGAAISAGVAAAIGLAAGVAKCTMMAADLRETTDKLGSIFGGRPNSRVTRGHLGS